MIELMKSFLHGNHDNYSTSKRFLTFPVQCGKKYPILNASRVNSFQLLNHKLCEGIDLSLLISKIKFLWEWTCQILGRDK